MQAAPWILRCGRAGLLAAALTSLTAAGAAAQGGINLSWDDCGPAGALQKNFACATNAGSSTLYGSAVTGIDMPQLNGQVSVIDVHPGAPTLPAWWQLAGGGCRAGAISANFDFVSNTACMDPWSGQAQGGMSYSPHPYLANTSRIRTVCAILGSTSITGTDEYYFFKVTIQNSKSTGEGSCSGCSSGACLIFESIQVTQPAGVGDYWISNPIWRNYVVWQSGSASACFVPTRRTSWGAVKQMYR